MIPRKISLFTILVVLLVLVTSVGLAAKETERRIWYNYRALNVAQPHPDSTRLP